MVQHLQKDGSGWQTFKYGTLGELTENIRTFALPFENRTYTFNMQYEYDPFNRMQSMTYPDGEVVSYGYNRGGMLNSIVGVKNGVPYKYLDSIRYNRFELRDTVFYGNGTWTEYAYDTLQRLKTLKSHTSSGAGTGELMQDIVYEYDHVGNITEISNTAGRLANGLGNWFYSHYTYDDLYRLTGSDGWWDGEDLAYQTQMSYLPNGRIERKYTDALVLTQTGTSNTLQAVHYDNRYHYNFSQPNTLSHIDTGSDQEFQWDAKGNMTKQINYTGNRNRYLCWDEQNRLLGVADEKHLSYYQYDANGERTLKLTGDPVVQNVSGQWHYSYPLNHPTLYASPYIVCNDKGYTKHYYAESERIASRIGGGGFSMLDMAVEPEWLSTQLDSSSRMCESVLECLGAAGVPKDSPMKNLYDWRDSVQPEKDCYWYHPDHLGSSSWITYSDGKAVQHLHYLPWGEDLVDQRLNSFDGVRYTFSAKERDTETGLSYFGSRYYSSDLSIWLSVDPMSDKYPSLSPYVYCANNPVRLVDPNGKDWFENELTGDVYYSKYLSKEDVSHIEGKGWKWMGEDNMFGSSPTQLTMVDHFDKASFVKSDQEGVETALFEGDNAKQFMSEMGYSFKPKLASVVSKDVTNMITEADGTPRYNTTHYDSYEKIHTSVYALKGSKGNYTILKATPYKDNPGPCVSITTRTELRLYDTTVPLK